MLNDVARFFMWTRLIAGYPRMNTVERKMAKIAWCSQWGYEIPSEVMPQECDWDEACEYNDMASFGDKVRKLKMDTISMDDFNQCQAALESAKIPYQPTNITFGDSTVPCISAEGSLTITNCMFNAPNKKENNMGYNDLTIDDGTTAQRNHLQHRVTSVYYDHRSAADEKFNRFPGKGPKTKDELTKRLTAGEFRLKKNYFDADGKLQHWSANEAIEWRTKDFDEAGWNTAVEALEVAYQKATDEVKILPPADGLASLRTFEAYVV